ncbi:uncharacterized protein TA09725 [Theileria annulata]|uniref:Mitochondrial carrier protein n=1 Tax=Theileria annulata TaxID=5874 RepID=Q4UJ55_THEAN|nr:uncharacterized protein TA09725 [Theileria annulata]CAI72884.1 hypothetical protein, conserved [Theileria annulata]|eukprot:XP_953562.1 hypothetical protein, conserved [Theileria annulata]
MLQYEKLKERLNSINIKRNKKRVTDTRLQLTQYISHIIPITTQRLILSPFIRSSLICQINSNKFKQLFNINNLTPINIFKGTYNRYGIYGLWKGTTLHILSGIIFPGIYIITNSITNKTKSDYFKKYLESLTICTFSHLFSYPFDTCFTRLSSNYNIHNFRNYIKQTIQNQVIKSNMNIGIRNLYSGFLLCLISTSTHLMITLPLNEQIQYKIIENINEEISKNVILKSNIKSLNPIEMKPVELYPFNLIFATVTSFISKTITYPIDTLKVKYQYSSKNGYKDFFTHIKVNFINLINFFREMVDLVYVNYIVDLV